ncbi:hypothetical protein CC1G_06878 [Coprinopsis cinerea okayama7|uniref:Nucleolar protein 16 n=1 Tax=Coprinopsis cinerea (strain Okayama-7 / 130 / ATCC MYA-4618 / FGSC 9003) TaxID=240176 RepID=A8N706_COPC7|nr:hypothetical protein CC1G_06878 [Coprinopsis cinerea okayama7\|eukprot:XP_001830612.2 hypothetical protein CC1G_06878 [Coprinopsis cinerea okayama7\
MANPRQRRKARSSSYKPVSHSKNAKRNLKKMPPIRGPKALQEAWDKKKTVRQNYARLGLVSDLNPISSGGSEKRIEPKYEDGDAQMSSETAGPSITSDAQTGESSKPLPKGFGRIIRDESGNVIGVELPQEDESKEAEQEDQEMEALSEPEVDGEMRDLWATNIGKTKVDVKDKVVGLVDELESIAMKKNLNSTTLSVAHSSTGPNLRHAAPGEIAYMRRLFEKYGDDVERMARDRKLNPDQRTAGQLRRALAQTKPYI